MEVDGNSTLDLSSRNVRFAQRKSKTGFELDRRQSHLRDSTVAPHSCHSGSGFLTCWTGVGELRRLCDTLSQGRVTGHRPQPQNPRRPKGNSCDNSYWGGGCLGHLPHL